MSSERYKTILAMLEDPVNFAIVQREVIRRRISISTPPIPKSDGGYMFVRTVEWPPARGSDPTPIAELFETPDGWIIFMDGSESQPLPSLKEAVSAAKNKLSLRGFLVIDEVPWE